MARTVSSVIRSDLHGHLPVHLVPFARLSRLGRRLQQRWLAFDARLLPFPLGLGDGEIGAKRLIEARLGSVVILRGGYGRMGRWASSEHFRRIAPRAFSVSRRHACPVCGLGSPMVSAYRLRAPRSSDAPCTREDRRRSQRPGLGCPPKYADWDSTAADSRLARNSHPARSAYDTTSSCLTSLGAADLYL
jgi:hypothetical protein